MAADCGAMSALNWAIVSAGERPAADGEEDAAQAGEEAEEAVVRTTRSVRCRH